MAGRNARFNMTAIAIRLISSLACVACIMVLVACGQNTGSNSPILNAELQKRLKQELRPITSGFYPRKTDDATLWGASGTQWVLDRIDHIPEDVAQFMDSFNWDGSTINFKTPVCFKNDETLTHYILTGKVDFSQNNRYSSNVTPQQMTLIPRKINILPSGAVDCTLKKSNWTRVLFKARGYKTDNVTIDLYDDTSQSSLIRLTYKSDRSLEPLANSIWRTSSGNDSYGFCHLNISYRGKGSASCCAYLGFTVNPTKDGWDTTQVYSGSESCLNAEGTEADAQMKRAISEGISLNNDGNLVAGPQTKTPMIFESVNNLEKLTGTWQLTGLVARHVDPRIIAMPKAHQVYAREALKDLNVELTVETDRLTLEHGCRRLSAKIIEQKDGYLRLGKKDWVNLDNCDSTGFDTASRMIETSTGQIIDDRAALKLDFYEPTDSLTLTRATIGSRARSRSWEFSR